MFSKRAPNCFERVIIFGGAGSGKSTLAMNLGQIVKNPVIHLDDVYHGPFWQEPHKEVFQERVLKILESPLWIIDGNYRTVRSFILSKATLAIILDLPFYVLFWRILTRTIGRNTRFKIGSVTPLPYQVYKSGASEHFPGSLIDLWTYALKFKRKAVSDIQPDARYNLGNSRVIILRRKREISNFLRSVQKKYEK